MADCILTTRLGETVVGPVEADLVSALEQFDDPDPEHPDCWLSDPEGWTLAVHEDGLVVLENVETGEGPWHASVAYARRR